MPGPQLMLIRKSQQKHPHFDQQTHQLLHQILQVSYNLISSLNQYFIYPKEHTNLFTLHQLYTEAYFQFLFTLTNTSKFCNSIAIALGQKFTSQLQPSYVISNKSNIPSFSRKKRNVKEKSRNARIEFLRILTLDCYKTN